MRCAVGEVGRIKKSLNYFSLQKDPSTTPPFNPDSKRRYEESNKILERMHGSEAEVGRADAIMATTLGQVTACVNSCLFDIMSMLAASLS